jgi:thioredoxin reductase (NADPH)
MYDCVIVGGGPAGLIAAIYLARYRRKVLVYDMGDSRALAIPNTHNYPGFVDGISGPGLLKRLRDQVQQYTVECRPARVETLQQCNSNSGFIIKAAGNEVSARCVLLATGLSDKAPAMAGLDEAVSSSFVRYCPVCDAFEAMDKNIALLGPVDNIAEKALFLRAYSRSVTILPAGAPGSAHDIDKLRALNIHVASTPPQRIRLVSDGIEATLESGERRHFDVIYPALGCDVHSELAKALGARCNAIGCIEVDNKQQTTVDGLYAAGDVVSDLHQLSVAAGHAAIAATSINNALPRSFR